MNKIIVILLLITTLFYAQSPISNGTYSVGGNVSYSSITGDLVSNRYNVFSLAPNGGYFFIDNFYTGASLLYIYESSNDFSSNTYGIGPSIRYYIDVDKLKPFLGMEYLYKIRISGDDPDENSYNTFSISAGADYFITNYFALEGILNYRFMSNAFEDGFSSASYKSEEFNIGFGVKFFIH